MRRPDQPAHSRRLIRVFALRTHNNLAMYTEECIVGSDCGCAGPAGFTPLANPIRGLFASDGPNIAPI